MVSFAAVVFLACVLSESGIAVSASETVVRMDDQLRAKTTRVIDCIARDDHSIEGCTELIEVCIEDLLESSNPCVPRYLIRILGDVQASHGALLLEDDSSMYTRLIKQWRQIADTNRSSECRDFFRALAFWQQPDSGHITLKDRADFARRISSLRVRCLFLYWLASEHSMKDSDLEADELYREVIQLAPGTYFAARAELCLVSGPYYTNGRWDKYREAHLSLKGRYPNFEMAPGDEYATFYECLDSVKAVNYEGMELARQQIQWARARETAIAGNLPTPTLPSAVRRALGTPVP